MSLRTAIELLLTTPELSDDEAALSPEAVEACQYAHAALAGTPIDAPPVVQGNIADCIATLRIARSQRDRDRPERLTSDRRRDRRDPARVGR